MLSFTRPSRLLARTAMAPSSTRLSPASSVGNLNAIVTQNVTAQRYKRYAPGLVTPDEFITDNTEIRDVLYTVALQLQRSWHWVKPYRELLLSHKKIRYVKDMKAYLQDDEWKQFMPEDPVKGVFESKISNAKPPK